MVFARGLALCALAAGLALGAGPRPATAQGLDLGAMTAQERALFRKEVRDYLMAHPEVLIEAIQVLEDRQNSQRTVIERDAIAQNSAALFDDDHSFVGGNPDGDITLVEFMDYRCGFCRRAHPEVAELLASDGNIRWVVKEYPILGPESVLASRFAISVLRLAGPEAYHAVHDDLMTLRGSVTPAALRQIADARGLDVERIMAGMEAPETSAAIETNLALARDLGINGTPTFVLPDRFLRGYMPVDQLRQVIEDARG